MDSCPPGYYGQGRICVELPQRCPPPTRWVGNRCYGHCPHSTYSRNGRCYPYVPCQHGQHWDQTLSRCRCSEGEGWNGERCIACGGGKVWTAFIGCQCKEGSFEVGINCHTIGEERCSLIPNSAWSGGECSCSEGYDAVGLQCLCRGVQVGNRCDRCAHLPHS